MKFRRFFRSLCLPLALALPLAMCFPPSTARAQEPAPAEGEAGGESSGRPLDGYLATLCIAVLALFIVGKSARR
jgi:hypothetical protein